MDSDSSDTPVISMEEYEEACNKRFAADNIQHEKVIKYLQTGKHVPGLTKAERLKVRRQATTFQWDSTKQVLFYTGNKCVMKREVVRSPAELARVLHLNHTNPIGGHSAWNATYEKVSKNYFWKNMQDDMRHYITTCNKCQRHTPLKTQLAPTMKPIKVKEPWELVGVDMIGPLPVTEDGHRYVCTFVDFTKFVDFFPLKNKSACGVGRCIMSFIHRWGPTGRILTDQGREFCSLINDELCKTYGIRRSITLAYHPQTNGLAERTNRTFKNRLAKLCNESLSNWDNYIEEVAYSLRMQKQKSTGFTPFQLIFNREHRPLDRDPLECDPVRLSLSHETAASNYASDDFANLPSGGEIASNGRIKTVSVKNCTISVARMLQQHKENRRLITTTERKGCQNI